MRLSLPLTALAAGVLALLGGAAAHAQTPIIDGVSSVLSDATLLLAEEFNPQKNSWRMAAGPIFLDRSQGPSRQLAGPGFGMGTVNTDQLKFTYKTGMQFNLIKQSNENPFGWDLDFFFVDSWLAVAAVPGQVKIFDPQHEREIIVDDNVFFQNGSSLYSSEFNARWQAAPDVTLLAGFRWIEFGDYLIAQQSLAPMASTYRTDVNNHLYGFQTGAVVALWDDGGPLYVNFLGKAGIYQNYADQNTSGPMISSSYNEGVHAAFAGQCTLAGTLQLTPRMSLRSGYTVLWLDGVALAPGQVYTAGTSLTQGDALYFNGGFVQLQINN
jgi:hypothetical protein